MVVPVPWTLAWSLKLLTRVSPATRRPVDAGTTATPYGFTSPLAGTVEAICETECSSFRNGGAACCAAATFGFELLDPHAARTSPSAATSAAARTAEMAGTAGTRSLTVLPFHKISDVTVGRIGTSSRSTKRA